MRKNSKAWLTELFRAYWPSTSKGYYLFFSIWNYFPFKTSPMLLHAGVASHIFLWLISWPSSRPPADAFHGHLTACSRNLGHAPRYFELASLLSSFYFPLEMGSHEQGLCILCVSRTCHRFGHRYSSYSELLAIRSCSNYLLKPKYVPGSVTIGENTSVRMQTNRSS